MEDYPETGIVHRDLDTKGDNPAVQVAETVADIEGAETTDLLSMHDCIDGVLDHVFSNPPSPDASLEIRFRYEGYDVTVEQDGHATFEKRE